MPDSVATVGIIAELESLASNEEKVKTARRIPSNQVIGVRMRDVFAIAKREKNLPLASVRTLLRNDRYEPRLLAVSILDFRARSKKASDEERRELFNLYLSEHAHIDSWDLVDRAAPRVIGSYLIDRDPTPLFTLSASTSTWERRTAITASFQLIRAGRLETPLKIIDALLEDPEHFVQTSVGVALREVVRQDSEAGASFIRLNSSRISPTTKRLMRDSRRA